MFSVSVLIFPFQFPVTRSTIVCNFINKRKLLVSEGGLSIPIWYIVIGMDKPLAGGCKRHLLVDKIITDVTVSVYIKCVSGIKMMCKYIPQKVIQNILLFLIY